MPTSPRVTKARARVVQLSMPQAAWDEFKKIQDARIAKEGAFVSLGRLALEGLRRIQADEAKK